MTSNPSSSDWATSRAERWRQQMPAIEALLRPVNAPLVDALALGTATRVADIGCGGGSTTRAVVRAAPQACVVDGFDIALPMIEAAKEHSAAKSISFYLADVSTTPPPNAGYDRLVSRFGTMFFEDPPAAFANLHRWLTPEGRFAFAVWGPPKENPWMTTVKDLVGRFVEIPRTSPDGPGPFRYANAEAFIELLRGAGFVDVKSSTWRGMLPMGGQQSPEDSARFALASFSNLSDLLATAGDTVVKSAHSALTELFMHHVVDGAVRLGCSVHIVTGAKSAKL